MKPFLILKKYKYNSKYIKFLPKSNAQPKMTSQRSSRAILQKFHLHSPSPPKKSRLDGNLDQAIRKNNVRYFIQKTALPQNQNGVIELETNKNLEDHLLNLKKCCNNLCREIKNKEQQTKKVQEENSVNTHKCQKIKQNQFKIQDQIAQLQKHLTQVNKKKDIAEHNSKTYEHVLARMKTDHVYNLQCKNDLQRKMQTLQKQLGITKTKHFNITQFQKQAEAGLKDAQDEFAQQNYSRKNNLNSVEQETQIKIDRQNKLKERQKQSQMIQQLAADDILDADLTKIKKFLTVQKFVRGLLKSKIHQLKNYYEPYLLAFLEIKIHSNVTDASTLKSQFTNFQNAFNSKAAWVKQLQSQIATAQQQQKQLKQKQTQIKINQMESIEKIQPIRGNGENNKKLLVEKSRQEELLWERIQSWSATQAKKMKLATIGNSISVFKEICNKLIPKQQQQQETAGNKVLVETH